MCDTDTCIGLLDSFLPCSSKALIKLDLPAPLGAERINKLPEAVTGVSFEVDFIKVKNSNKKAEDYFTLLLGGNLQPVLKACYLYS